MIAAEPLLVGNPVTADGRVAHSIDEMVGLAARRDYLSDKIDEGESFEVITDKHCLAVLVSTMFVRVGGQTHALVPYDQNYVTVRGGKIVDFLGSDRFGS